MSEFENMQAQKKAILEKEKAALLRPYLEKIAQLEDDSKQLKRIVELHEEINKKLKLLAGVYYFLLAASYYQDCLEGYYDTDEEYHYDGN